MWGVFVPLDPNSNCIHDALCTTSCSKLRNVAYPIRLLKHYVMCSSHVDSRKLCLCISLMLPDPDLEKWGLGHETKMCLLVGNPCGALMIIGVIW